MRISDWSSDVCSSDLYDFFLIKTRRSLELILGRYLQANNDAIGHIRYSIQNQENGSGCQQLSHHFAHTQSNQPCCSRKRVALAQAKSNGTHHGRVYNFRHRQPAAIDVVQHCYRWQKSERVTTGRDAGKRRYRINFETYVQLELTCFRLSI